MTISDIAAAAGVSKATVSRVLNGIPSVNEEIAQRVRAVVADVGFTPSLTARSLSLGESRTVGVLVPDLGNPLFHQVLHGFNSAAARDGYRVVVADAFEDADAEPDLARDLRSRTDAIALFAPRMTRENLLALLPRIAPSVVFNRTTGMTAGSVLIEYRQGTVRLARHLAELGHSRIAFLAGPSYSRANIEREKGLDDFEAATDGVEIIRLPCGHSFEDGYRAWPALRDTGATAVIAYNDVVALGLLGRLSEEGVSVPNDLSVAGFDGIPSSRYSAPPLTTMTTQLHDVGVRLWAVLRSEMSPHPDREPIMITPELAVRASTKASPTIDLLKRDGAAVAYHDGLDIERALSPRPYLTATTPGGVPVTEVGPADHRHHFGLSFAVPDVNGSSFWGGRTYVRDVGSTMLDNHGIQRVVGRALGEHRLAEELTWFDHEDRPLLHEERTIVAETSGSVVEISWRSRLTAVDRDVTFGSPQTNGRPGAFYGGLFWRTPFDSADVRTADGEGIDAAHGSRSPWLAVEGPAATIVAVTTTGMPWFVRSEGYVGFGPALAVAERRRLDAGDTLAVDLSVALVDGRCEDPEALVARLAVGAPER